MFNTVVLLCAFIGNDPTYCIEARDTRGPHATEALCRARGVEIQEDLMIHKFHLVVRPGQPYRLEIQCHPVGEDT